MHCDFSLGHYRQILETALKSGYRFIGFDEAEQIRPDEYVCILRHDVDYLPEWTVALGRIEYELEIRSTYFFQTCAKTYNLRETANYQAVRQLKGWGHWIGLHFDSTWKSGAEWEEIPSLCAQDKVVFEALTGLEPCDIISFHNPHRFVDRIINQTIPGFRHTYEKRYFQMMKYLSDSQGWYEGCVCQLFAARKYPAIQLLLHADYWPERTTGDFIGDIAQLIKYRSDELTEYLLKYHPVCKKNEPRLIDEIRKLYG